MTVADPHGRVMDVTRSCYEAWMRVPDHADPIRIRWYGVDPPAGSYELSDYSSSDWDGDPKSYDPPLGEQSTTRDPWRDWRDCSPPPWPPSPPVCAAVTRQPPPERVSFTASGFSGSAVASASNGQQVLTWVSECTWDGPTFYDDGTHTYRWRFAFLPPGEWFLFTFPTTFIPGPSYDAGVSPWNGHRTLHLDESNPVGITGPPCRIVYPGYQPDPSQTPQTGCDDMPLIGSLVPFAGPTVPAGYLLCDGSAVSRTTYASLFAAIGTAWGAGDGVTTFNLPDLRGRVVMGTSGAFALGSTGGEQTHTLTTPEIPSHTHNLTDPGHVHPADTASGNLFLEADGATVAGVNGADFTSYNAITANSQTDPAVTGMGIDSTGGGGGHNNLQPYAVVLQLIYAGA